MAANKTAPAQTSVKEYLDQIDDKGRREDCAALVELMKKATGEKPQMWGSSIVGFGVHRYRYASGREGESCAVGFSARKSDLTIYGLGMGEVDAKSLAELGKYKTGKGCLYVKKLGDINSKVLQRLVKEAFARKKSA